MASKKWTVGFGVLVAVLSLWAGYQSWYSPAFGATIQAALAIFIAGNLLFMTILWYRARPESGDAMVLPTFILLSVAMLVGILPRLFWPAEDQLQFAASVGSLVLSLAVAFPMIRRNRKLLAARLRGDTTHRP